MKLTKRQNEIIHKLQNGWILLTGENYVEISKGFDTKPITLSMFFKLVNMGLIYQQLSRPFDYVLTDLGETIPTKPANK